MYFDTFETVFFVMFAAVICLLVFVVVKGAAERNRNNNSPKLTVNATVAEKRTGTTHQQIGNAGDITGAHGYTTQTSTTYYAAFQVESGELMELVVSGAEYRNLTEGDCGKLTYQGTRYIGFEKT